MAMAASSAGGSGQWPGMAGTGQLALAGGHYYCPVPTETLLSAPGTGPAAAGDQLVYAATQPGSYQTLDLSDGTHHLVATGQSSEVIPTSDVYFHST